MRRGAWLTLLLSLSAYTHIGVRRLPPRPCSRLPYCPLGIPAGPASFFCFSSEQKDKRDREKKRRGRRRRGSRNPLLSFYLDTDHREITAERYRERKGDFSAPSHRLLWSFDQRAATRLRSCQWIRRNPRPLKGNTSSSSLLPSLHTSCIISSADIECACLILFSLFPLTASSYHQHPEPLHVLTPLSFCLSACPKRVSSIV